MADQPMKQSGVGPLIKFTILALVGIVAFSSRLFAVIRFESIIHEFDPWFNYRATRHLVEEGFYDFLNWFDDRAWYPLGRIVGGTVYPGLMVTSGAIHYVLHSLHIPIHIKDVCVFLAPLFSFLTALATYFFTTEVWDEPAGLLAAACIGIIPGYISRSVAGSYDNEGIAITALMTTYFFWMRAVKRGSMFWGALTAVSYFYMVGAWGGYVFIINLIPLHVLVLLLMGRVDGKIYTGYCTFFILGLLLSMQIPFVGFLPIQTSEHMASVGVFGLLQLHAGFQWIQTQLSNAGVKQEDLHRLYRTVVGAALVLAVPALATLNHLGYVAPFSGRFYSLYDTGYAKIHIPIIASVSEHQPTTWTSFLMDLHFLGAFFPAGLYFVLKKSRNEHIFLVLYAVSAVYFAGVMVRLMLTLTPIVVVLGSIAASKTLTSFASPDGPPLDDDNTSKDNAEASPKDDNKNEQIDDVKGEANDDESEEKEEQSAVEKENDAKFRLDARIIVTCLLLVVFGVFVLHCTWVTSNAYSSPSVVLATYNRDGSRNILDDFRGAYYWLRQNTHENARVMSWWDYGYQIAGFSNRTTLVDNNTWNNSHIAMVGMAMSSNESRAHEIMTSLDVDYVLVIFGGVIGYSGDDINKFLWMVRIAEGEHPEEITETDYFTERGEYRMDSEVPERMRTSLMYKMCYYRFGEMPGYGQPTGYDRTRNVEIGDKNIELTHIEEAYTSENWLVRIYKVLPVGNYEQSTMKRRNLSGRKPHVSRPGTRKTGVIRNSKAKVFHAKPGKRVVSARHLAKRK